jgi:Omp85 superfamily domain
MRAILYRTPAAWIVILAARLALSGDAARAAPAQPRKRSIEFNIVPVAGGDSDVGIGVGEVADLARLDPAYRQYRWRLESGAFITFKLRDQNRVIIPYQDYYLVLSLPDLTASRRLRLDIRPSFTNESTLKFYGIGNAAPLPPAGLPVEDSEYGRMHPTLSVEARYRVYERFYVLAGSIYTHNWLTVRPTSLLAQAQSSPSPEVRGIVGTFGPHGVEVLEAAAEYDTRDNETVTRSGQFHTALFRISPRNGTWLPYAYERVTLTARFYTTPVRRWLTLSFRLASDTLLGNPPFYELARFDETAAIGGGRAVRGVPAQRYYGKVKLFENLEARSDLLPFTFRGKHMVLGAALFADAGRSWTELGKRHPDLDGTGLGLKYGLGGGLRLQEGETFVVRADVAWSPDARPVGAYFAAGEIF